jgi:hypothetical protein
MNKKLLFLALLVASIFLPTISYSATPSAIFNEVEVLATNIGMALVVVGWIIAGVLYLMAAGNPEKIQTAKKAMIASIIGTILIVFAVAGYAVIEGLLTPILNP